MSDEAQGTEVTSRALQEREFSVATAQALGQRAEQEDRAAFAVIGDCLVAVLADGVGGHDYGAEAAESACQSMIDFFKRHRRALSGARDLHSLLDRAVNEASARMPRSNKMNAPACTLVIALAFRDRLVVRNIGDSRAFRSDGFRVWPLTRDHGIGRFLASCMPHPRQQDTIDWTNDGAPYAFVLCSDGLTLSSAWAPSHDHEQLASPPDMMHPERVAESLVKRQLKANVEYQDNVTVVVGVVR